MNQVYFLHASAVNLIKIGFSRDPERRFEKLRLLSPVPLRVIGVIEGGAEVEALLHQKFAAIRDHGEWFHATKDLLHFAHTEILMAAWNAASQDARDEFLSRIDRPVMDNRWGAA